MGKIQLSNLSLEVQQSGQGSPVVLLHGLASSKRIWDLVVPKLEKKSSVFALDQRGHGLSDKPTEGYSFNQMRDDLVELMAVLGLEQITLVGHSWGADVALNFAAYHPEYLYGLCLVDGGLIDFQKYLRWSETEKLLSPPDNEGVKEEDLLKQFPNWLGPAWTPDAIPILLSLFERQDNATFRPRLGKTQHMEIVRALWEQRPYPLFDQVNCPTTCLLAVPPLPHSDYTQRLTQYRLEGLEQAQRSIATMKKVVLNDTIHDVPIHRPDVVAQEIIALLP